MQRKNDHYAMTANVSFEVKKMPYNIQPAKLPAASIAVSTKHSCSKVFNYRHACDVWVPAVEIKEPGHSLVSY